MLLGFGTALSKMDYLIGFFMLCLGFQITADQNGFYLFLFFPYLVCALFFGGGVGRGNTAFDFQALSMLVLLGMQSRKGVCLMIS